MVWSEVDTRNGIKTKLLAGKEFCGHGVHKFKFEISHLLDTEQNRNLTLIQNVYGGRYRTSVRTGREHDQSLNDH